MLIQEALTALKVQVNVPEVYNIEVDLGNIPESGWLYRILTEVVELYTSKLVWTQKYHLYIDEGGYVWWIIGGLSSYCTRLG